MGHAENSERTSDQNGASESRATAVEEHPAPAKEAERVTRRFRGSGASGAERDRLLRAVRNIDFPTGLRGYERGAVDRYVEQVNRLIAELEISSSPESAVRHALDEVSEETRDLLQRAHETADGITARSRAKADERLELAAAEAEQLHETAQRKAEELREAARRDVDELRDTASREVAEERETVAQEAATVRAAAAREAQQLRSAAQREADETRATANRDATELIENASARARELARNAEAIWRERRRLVDDMRAVGEQLVAIGETEGKRFTHSVADELLSTERSRGEEVAPPVGQGSAPPG